MKKICMITTVSLTMKSFVVEMADYLHHQLGYDVTLICDRDDSFAASLPEYLHYIPVRMSRGIDLSAISSIFRFYRIFRKEKFDLVQYATPNAACYASIASFFARVPVRLYAQWGIRYVGLSGMSRRIFKQIEKLICRLSTHVRSQSPKNMQFVIDEKLCKKEKVAVIGIGGTIGVDLSECDRIPKEETRSALREKYAIPEDAFVYGFVGRINRDKGINELLSAFASLRKKHDRLYLFLIGGIDDKNTVDPALLQCAREDEHVVFAGSVPASEVYAHMTAMDVLVHPTYREGFGKVIQEGMGMSLPIITTDIPGPSEVIENHRSGVLVSVKDSADLAEKMELLFVDEALRISFATEGRLRAETYFDRPIMLHNIACEMKKIGEETANVLQHHRSDL